MSRKIQIIPKTMYVPLALTLLMNGLAYNGTRLLTAHRVHTNIAGKLDARIPFVPWTAAIYLGCYLFWAVNYVIACRQETSRAFRFFSADIAAKTVCLVCFLVFPTTNTRPVIAGDSFWENVMRLIYRLDAADNLFPSIHCLTSWFCYIAVRGNSRVPRWYCTASFWIACSVFVSTLTTKQHVLADVVAGVALAELSYRLVEICGFSGWYQKRMEQVAGLRKKGSSTA